MIREPLSRRKFLCACCGGLLLSALPAALLAAEVKKVSANTASKKSKKKKKVVTRRLWLEHLHTKEKIDIVYWKNGKYNEAALKKINHFLRDFRTLDETEIDPELLDQVVRLHKLLKVKQPFQVVSAYRSPKTNEMLREQSGAVAEKSLHMQGRAIDLSLENFSIKKMRKTALGMEAGGVGYYPGRFIHIDTGDVRKWVS